MGYRLHTDDWPVVRYEFIGRVSADELDQYFAHANALVTGGKPYACVMDATDMLLPDADLVRKQVAWLREHDEAMRRTVRGIALVVESTMIRGLVRAVMHFQDVPVPLEWFATLKEAMPWAAARAAIPVKTVP